MYFICCFLLLFYLQFEDVSEMRYEGKPVHFLLWSVQVIKAGVVTKRVSEDVF